MASVLYNPEKVLILGIAGHARSGKDTAAQFITEFFKSDYDKNFAEITRGLNLNIFRFADPIKNATAEFMKYFVTDNVSDRLFDEYVLQVLDEYKNNGELLHGIDIRKSQQQLGSVMRNQNKNIFVEIMIERIKNVLNTYTNASSADFFKFVSEYERHVIIIPDTRFTNEEELMREAFGDCYKLILIDRPEITKKAAQSEPPYDHESEQQIKLLKPDIKIKNNYDLDELKKNTINQIKKLLIFQGWTDG